MKFGIIVFPGSNCDHDAYHVISKQVGQPVDFIWHRDTNLNSFDALIIPGGFSYGDYLRAGALARFSPVMESVKKFAATGRFVLGHMQWLSDSLRSRAVAGRPDPQSRFALHL